MKPPSADAPEVSRKSYLIGYFALPGMSFNLSAGQHKKDRFKCNIGCYAPGQISSPTSMPSSVSSCKCGVLSRGKRESSLSRAFLPKELMRKTVTHQYQRKYLRIVGGTSAEPGSVPWQASMAIAGEIFCGASLVTDRHLVTAAHCTVQIGGSLTSQVDILLNLYTRGDISNQIKRKISKIVMHPQFDTESLVNDIALVTLSSSVHIDGGKS